MSRPRARLTSGLALAFTCLVTTWVAMLSWRGFTEIPARFLVPIAFIGACIALVGAVGRWARVPGVLVVLAQVVVAVALGSYELIGTFAPVGAGATELRLAFEDALDSSKRYAAPVPVEAVPVYPLLVAGGVATVLLVDVLACTMRRVPLAGLPLLAVYSVPVSLLSGGLTWWIFLLTAVGFLTMLYLHESEQLARWGRPLGLEPSEAEPTTYARTGTMRTSAGRIGSVATGLAVVVPLAIPTLSLDLFDAGFSGGGDDDISIENPMVDLRRDLIRGEDIELVTVTTDDPDPGYLRISVLNRFSTDQWSNGDRDVPEENLPDGNMPPLAGLAASVPRTTFDYEVGIGDAFDSTWLPTQAPISAIDASGDWRYDDETMDFLSSNDDLSAAGMEYTMTGVQPDLEASELAAATPADSDVSDELLDLPPELPTLVRELATGVTERATTRFEKAVALQNWFRDEGGFVYSLDDAPNGNSTEDLESFLTDDADGRIGYCEQFAASMAVMARVLGIPSRVAVGFLRPQQLDEDTWEYSAHDLHAWPELYFRGAGWVRFEPTPAVRASNVPAYTTEPVTTGNPDGPSPSASPSAAPNSQQPRPTEGPTTAPEVSSESSGQDDGGLAWGPIGGGVAGALLLVGVAVLPRGLRRRARDTRLDGGAESAWEELAASARDLGVPWPTGRSPRETRDQVVQYFGVPGQQDGRPSGRPEPEARTALDSVVGRLELARYSRTHDVPPGALRDDVLTCVGALSDGATPRARRRAEWLPRSLFSRRPRSSTRSVESVPSGAGGIVEHI